MRVHLLLFAVLRDVVGQSELLLELPAGSTAEGAWNVLRQQYPLLQRYSAPPLFAVDEAYVDARQLLREGAELALIPPVSGG